jgi:hypothetical protein
MKRTANMVERKCATLNHHQTLSGLNNVMQTCENSASLTWTLGGFLLLQILRKDWGPQRQNRLGLEVTMMVANNDVWPQLVS